MFEGYGNQVSAHPADMGMSLEQERDRDEAIEARIMAMWQDRGFLGIHFMDELCCMTDVQLGELVQTLKTDPLHVGAKLLAMTWRRLASEAEREWQEGKI